MALELLHAQLLVPVGGEHVERYEEDGGGEAGKGRYAQVAPQHVDADEYLQRRRPQHVDERQYVEKQLRIDRHQVGHLAHRRRLARRGRQAQALLVDHVDESGAHARSDQIHAKVVVLQQHGLNERRDEEQTGEEDAHDHLLLLVLDELDD